MKEIVYVGIKGTVIAFDRQKGACLWEKSLAGSGFVNILVDGDRLIVTTHGQVFCLAAATGKTLWHDPLKGYGYGLATIATPRGSSHIAPAEQLQQEHARAASAASTATNLAST